MAEFKGTKTETNLLKAFAGESQARNRYTFFAEAARKEGLEQIAAIFEETAKQAAYDVQKQSWSKSDVVGRDARLSQAKLLGSTPAAGDLAQTARLQQAIAGAQPLGVTGTSAAPPFTPAVIRSLAVAALAVLGEASEPKKLRVTRYCWEIASRARAINHLAATGHGSAGAKRPAA